MAKLGQYAEQLPSMSAQEVFDISKKHLLEQKVASFKFNKGSTQTGKCLYNHPDGICCAAAPFLSDYNESMENITWAELVSSHGQNESHEGLLRDLQRAHDTPAFNAITGDALVKAWVAGLEHVAKAHHLKY